MKTIERTYNKTMKALIKIVNPIKKKVKKTDCIVHKFLNNESLRLLKQEGYDEEYRFYKEYISDLNKGVKWADSDFKSTNHFYHHEKGIGLYGFSNAKKEFVNYYQAAIFYGVNNDMNKSMFLLGAACHLIQDSTVPAHAMKRLKKHKPFEDYIIDRVKNGYSIKLQDQIKRFDHPEKYITENTVFAVMTLRSFADLRIKKDRFKKVSEVILLRACNTTAGLMLDFYNTIKSIDTDTEH